MADAMTSPNAVALADTATCDAILAVERAGHSPALSEAVDLLTQARERLAYHVKTAVAAPEDMGEWYAKVSAQEG